MKHHIAIYLRCVLFLAFLFTANGSAWQQKLTNQDVIKMVKAGLSPEIIEQTINSSDQAFDVSTDGLITLKQEGVADAIVQVMILRAKNVGKPRNQPNPNGDCGFSETDPMILVDGVKRVELKYSTPETRLQLGAGALIGRGKSIATLKGSRAEIRITNSSPIFEELYVPVGMRPENAAVLAKLDMKSDRREIEIASETLLSASFGIPKNRSMPIVFEVASQTCVYQGKRLRHVKIKVVNPLEPGEYSLIIGAQYYDFGVDTIQKSRKQLDSNYERPCLTTARSGARAAPVLMATFNAVHPTRDVERGAPKFGG